MDGTAARSAATPGTGAGPGGAVAGVSRDPLTRESVVAAARAQIQEHGLESLSLRRIASALGVTAPALYAYVTDKRDLLRAVAETAFADLLERFEAIAVEDPIERMRQLSRAYVDYSVANPELFRTMFLFPPDLAMGGSTGEELPLATHTFNYAIDAISAAQAGGLLRTDLDPLLVTLTSWTATHGLADVLSLGFAFDDATRDLIVDNVIDTVLRGLRP